jgi:hypothetical protein
VGACLNRQGEKDKVAGLRLGQIFTRLIEDIEDILTIEGIQISSYLLKSIGNLMMSLSYRFGAIFTHNPKVGGSNPSPAT